MKTFLILSIVLLILSFSGSQAQWQYINSPQQNISDMLIFQNDKIIVGTNSGVYFSTDNGNNWEITLISVNTNLLIKDNLGNIYSSSGSLYKSIDSGLTWEQLTVGSITGIYINDLNHILILSNESGCVQLLASTDVGITWSYLLRMIVSDRFYTYSVTGNSSRTVFMSYYDRYLRWKVILKKEVNGNWASIVTGIVALDMCFYNEVMYIATQSEGIYKSYDNGLNIIPINNGLTNLKVTQLILKPEVFLALSGDGIYRSLDQGNYWTRLDDIDLNPTINRIYYDDNKNLYACTQNGLYLFTGVLPVELLNFTSTLRSGIITLNWSTTTELNNQGFEIQRKTENSDWVTIGFKEGNGTTSNQSEYSFADDISYLTDREIKYRLKQVDFNGSFTYSNEIEVFLNPIEFSLSQNYPNPFNPTTKISYQLPKESKVVLRVYDILGSEVATIVNEYQEAGYKELDFDASSLSSGVYIYKIVASDFVSSKKMIVVK